MFDATEFVEVTLLPEEYRLPATIRHSDGKHLLISVDPGEAALIVPGAQVQLVQTVDGGLYQCNSMVVNRRDNMFVTKIGNPQLLQRRRSKRYDCAIPTPYRLNVTLAEIQNTPDADCELGNIHDLSLGGAKMAVKMLICANSPLALRIRLNEKEVVHAEGSVVRCTMLKEPVKTPEGALQYVVAVRFGCVPRIDQVQLHRFLLQLT